MWHNLGKPALLAATLALRVTALAPTDTYRDADIGQSGYLPNHNMDPAVVDSTTFGPLWKKAFNAKEQFYAKPLVYTPNAGGPQLLFLASSQNIIRTLNAKTGDLVNTRTVHTPFLQADTRCPDIANTIGIIGTPTIDPNTDIAYFFSKTYIANYRTAGATGTFNGVYYFHGVDINTLQDVPGYPILIDGSNSDNRPAAYFIGGTVLQRPSLLQVGNYVYGAFGAHCDLFNYTGLVIGIDIAAKKIATSFATETGPLVPQTNIWDKNGDGGQGGIWMSGMGLSSDGNRLFWVSGNGVGHENAGTPASGSSGCKTLGEAAVNLGIGADGKLTLTDYFQPFDYINFDGNDQDFGSGGIVLLDPGTFKGTGVTKIAVTVGKSPKIYILNANNLGGYKLGPGQSDGILQTIPTSNSVFGGPGSYPGEGGYIYVTPINYPTYVYKLGFSGSGVPFFSQVGATQEKGAGRVGVGTPTITSLNGKPGSAILWTADPDAGLRAWYAVPQQDGTLKRINFAQENAGLNKFQRPVFGDTRVYVSDPNGVLYCLGSPVNLPLTCNSPVEFGDVALGSKATKMVSCTANIPITSISDVSTGDAHFVVNKADLPQGAIAKGTAFSFPATWDLTSTTVSNQPGASFGTTVPGVKSTALKLTTVNGVPGYSTQLPITLTGNQVSQNAFFILAPRTVDYGGLVILDKNNPPTSSLPFTFSNKGLSPLTIKGYAYTADQLDNNPAYTNVSFAGGAPYSLSNGFTSSNLPAIGTVIQGGGQITVGSSFKPINGVGDYYTYFTIWTTGGSDTTTLQGSASTAAIATLSIGTTEGGWLPASNLLLDFGKVAPGTTSSRKIRICNSGGSVLEITKSKPPSIYFRPEDPNSLHESTQIAVNDCAYATVLFVANAEGPNVPDQSFEESWTLNTNDLTFGVHVVDIKGTVVSKKVGPTSPTGDAVYTYLGCYSDTKPGGRLLPPGAVYADGNNNVGRCQTVCYGQKAIFEGTEYQTECYCGNIPPPDLYKADETMCNFACSGDATQSCGGPGGYINIYYDATRYTPGSGTTTPGGGGGTSPSGPVVVQSAGVFSYAGCYTEATQGRALSAVQNPQGVAGATLTVESCATACKAYAYMGVEYSGECYCGNTLGAGSVVAPGLADPAANGCNMLCNGNQTEYCGGAGRLNLYKAGTTPPTSSTPGPNPPTSPTPNPPQPPPTGPITVTQLAGYSYLGCYSEATGQRALTDLQNPIGGALVSVEACQTACAKYTYFGVEYSGECYCGNTINAGSALVAGTTVAATGCNMLCNANKTEYCGGGNRLNMYKKGAGTTVVSPPPAGSPTSPAPSPTSTTPAHVQTVGNYAFQGCYTEGTTSRALTGAAFYSATLMTIEMCATNCKAYTYFGVEYGQECYCGNTLQAGSVPAAKLTDCSFLCPGNKLEYCGAGNRLELYKVNAAAPKAAFRVFNAVVAEVPSGTANITTSTVMQSIMIASTGSGAASTTSSGTVSNSNSTATSTSGATGLKKMFSSSTTTSGSGNGTLTSKTSTDSLSITSQASPSSLTSTSTSNSGNGTSTSKASTDSSSTTSKASSSSSTSTSTSKSSSSSPGSTSSTASTTSVSSNSTSTSEPSTTTSKASSTTSKATTSSKSSTSTSSSSTTSSSSLHTPTPGLVSNGWTYLGCSNTTTPPLPHPLPLASTSSSTNMTLSTCQNFCSSSKYNYGLAGLSNGQDCFCGNGLQNYAAVQDSEKGCDVPCSGDKSEVCGGKEGISVWNLTASVLPATTVKQVGYYLSEGCYPSNYTSKKESTPLLTSDHTLTNKTAMTVESCINYCSDANFPVAGVSEGYTCTCASSLPSTVKSLDAKECNLPCVGNSREFCGAYQKVNVYKMDENSVNKKGEAKSLDEGNEVVVKANGTRPVKREEGKMERSFRGVGRSGKLF